MKNKAVGLLAALAVIPAPAVVEMQHVVREFAGTGVQRRDIHVQCQGLRCAVRVCGVWFAGSNVAMWLGWTDEVLGRRVIDGRGMVLGGECRP